jgi:hypothetical protein
MFGSDWPRYGFDEWFLTAAVYPRLAPGGVATFFPAAECGFTLHHWFVLDIEYVTWANPRSEVIYFGPTRDYEGKPTSHDSNHLLNCGSPDTNAVSIADS